MKLLRYVGPGDDADHVIVEVSGAGSGERFSLYVDDALREAARSDLPRLPRNEPDQPAAGAVVTPTPEPVSEAVSEQAASIGPREIQMRVRAGESPQELAGATGMALDRVLRFAGPVLAERTRIADEARRARARRSTSEGQVVVFGEAVEARFATHGIDPAEVTWDARRRDDGQWVVSAHWVGGELDRTAEWVFHLSGRTVTPIDDTAADLLSDRPIRPVLPRVSEEGSRPVLTVAPPLAPGVVAFPAMPDAHTGPLPTRDDVFDQEAVDPDAPRRPAARAQAQPTEPDGYDAPQLPLRLPGAPSAAPSAAPAAAPQPRVTNLGIAHREDESEEERAARARIPSWDDILLGVRRKGD